MVEFRTVNPRDEQPLGRYLTMPDATVKEVLAKADAAFRGWSARPLPDRLACLARLATLLTEEAPRLGALATEEMGKPIAQAVKEVEKCALACRHYAEHGAAMLADEPMPGSPGAPAGKGFVAFRPLGPILGIMPWNFPYWQVFRFAAPTLAVGNTVILKHAENTTGCALAMQELLPRAGFPPDALQVLLLGHEELKDVIADPRIHGVSLTGSERAGASVGATAGAALKKTVLELGGSDAYIVLRDADVERAAKICVEARLVNNGQSCVAAKRFIVDAAVHDRFVDAFVGLARQKKVGDPRDKSVDVGPLAKRSILEGVADQVQRSLQAGAKALLGGTRPGGPGCYYPVTVLAGAKPGMACFDEEVFGPVAAIVRAESEDQAFELANRSRYGLGGAIFSKDLTRAERLAKERLEAGFVVVNGMVASDPRLPFGGVKLSGYGRELSRYGLLEFANIKTVVVNA